MFQYKLNERVIVRGQGVAEIIDIIERSTSTGESLDFYVLKVFDKDVQFMVPTMNNTSIRRPISESEVKDIFNFLGDKDFEAKTGNWNKRLREYTDKLKNGSIYDVAAILKDLNLAKTTKKLSFSEDKIYKQAKELVIQELVVSDNSDKMVVEFKIEECLSYKWLI